MKRPLVQLILIQFREFVREPAIIFWALIFPILITWGLGIAFSKKSDAVHHIAYIENTTDCNPLLKAYLSYAGKDYNGNQTNKPELVTFATTQNLGKTYFHFIKCDLKEAEHLLKIGKVSIILHEKKSNIEYDFDPANPEAKLTYLQLSSAIAQQTTVNSPQESFSIIYYPLSIETIKPLSEIGTRYIDFLVPGLIAMGIMSSLLWGVCYGLIDKRNKKLLRRMVATPMRKSDFLISHFIARLILSFIESFVLYLFAWFYFKINISGNPLALILIIIAGNIAFSGIAVLAASRTSNTEVGNGLINAVQMPMMVLSGIFFSYHNFPDWAIPVIKLLPLTMLADGMRSIFIEGAGFKEVLLDIIVLSGIGVAFFSVSLKIYKWY